MSNGAWPEAPSPRFILNRLLRRDRLCHGANVCPEVPWDEQRGEDPLPCDECPRVKLDRYMLSEPGRVLTSALQIDGGLRCGLQVGLDDVSYAEYLRLRILFEERKLHEIEEMKTQREEHEREQEQAIRRGRQ